MDRTQSTVSQAEVPASDPVGREQGVWQDMEGSVSRTSPDTVASDIDTLVTSNKHLEREESEDVPPGQAVISLEALMSESSGVQRQDATAVSTTSEEGSQLEDSPATASQETDHSLNSDEGSDVRAMAARMKEDDQKLYNQWLTLDMQRAKLAKEHALLEQKGFLGKPDAPSKSTEQDDDAKLVEVAAFEPQSDEGSLVRTENVPDIPPEFEARLRSAEQEMRDRGEMLYDCIVIMQKQKALLEKYEKVAHDASNVSAPVITSPAQNDTASIQAARLKKYERKVLDQAMMLKTYSEKLLKQKSLLRRREASSPKLKTQQQSTHSFKDHQNQLEAWVTAPFPRSAPVLSDEGLRSEVSRTTIGYDTVDPKLDRIYHIEGLEQLGDVLVKLILLQVRSHWVGQLKQLKGYKELSRAFHDGLTESKTIGFALSNYHFSILARQFNIGPSDANDPERDYPMKRLADHFEAYIYALYLDQGIDALGRFLGPIFVHSLYKGGQHFGFTLNKKEKVVSLEKEGRASELVRIEHEGLPIPDWHVPCSKGYQCTQQQKGCYFYHPPAPSPAPTSRRPQAEKSGSGASMASSSSSLDSAFEQLQKSMKQIHEDVKSMKQSFIKGNVEQAEARGMEALEAGQQAILKELADFKSQRESLDARIASLERYLPKPPPGVEPDLPASAANDDSAK